MEWGLKTGDVLLCDFTGGGAFGWFSSAIKYFTESEFSHTAVVLKDPTFVPLVKGWYVWESTYDGEPDPQDDRIKLGVKITPFDDFLKEYTTKGKLYVRKLYTNETISEDKLKDIHDVVYHKPYDIVPKDWYDAYERKDPNPQRTSRFWCSALVGYIYTQLGLYPKTTDWTMMRPSDIAEDRYPMQNGYLGSLVQLK